jgi:hypothetical protein
MNAVLSSRTGRMQGGRVATVLRVFRGGMLMGAILLNTEGRTERCTPDIPPDVVLKVLFRFSKRDEKGGTVPGRDGGCYAWHVLGHETETETETDESAA